MRSDVGESRDRGVGVIGSTVESWDVKRSRSIVQCIGALWGVCVCVCVCVRVCLEFVWVNT